MPYLWYHFCPDLFNEIYNEVFAKPDMTGTTNGVQMFRADSSFLLVYLDFRWRNTVCPWPELVVTDNLDI